MEESQRDLLVLFSFGFYVVAALFKIISDFFFFSGR